MSKPAVDTIGQPDPAAERVSGGLLVRAAVGGVMMGLANLVPGISGGTMLVAVGIYTRFIDAISSVTRLKLTRPTILLLGTVVLFAGIAIAGCSGLIAALLETHRWAMYSLFIGLTWGGAPLIWRMIRESKANTGKVFDTPVSTGLIVGMVVMAGLAALQLRGAEGGGGSDSIVMLALGGVAGASAMILPGVSGAYLLLLLGLYDTIVNAIKDSVSAAKDANLDALFDQLSIVVPVGVGVVVGIAVVANVLRFVLHRYERATLGVLLGLLIAAPAGLYPFREGIPPEVGDVIKGQTIATAEEAAEVKPKDWPQRTFTPTGTHLGGSLGLIVVGLGVTLAIDRLGRKKPRKA